MIAVLDTNVLVSALWSSNGKAAYILQKVIAGDLKLCHSYQILTEYREVLLRPKFKFKDWQVNFLLETIEKDGFSVIPTSLPNIKFIDESDRIFYEVAKFCNAPLVTGNLKHFPNDDCIMTVSDFYQSIFQ
ncbi:MAG: putative toxin-antitoxin system toxin component, PIN family [Selenomonadaceae bacterium]|nr:putative toxin-antitoxin system toxin component, PIN family [Selenomonadaceae bacterium]